MINGNFNEFRFWCHKVLPLVYDDSLSYYEVLCKCVKCINELIEQDKIIGDELEKLKEELAEVEKFIEDFDIEVAERLVREAIANFTSILFTSTIPHSENVADVINEAIRDNENLVHVVYFDSDVTIDKSIDPVSNCKFIGAGGIITMTDSGHFHNTQGTEIKLTDCSTTINARATYVDVVSAASISVGQRYKIIGTENMFDKSVVGADNWLDSGTEHSQTVYGGFEFIVKQINGNRVTFDRPSPYYIGANAGFYQIGDISNVVFRDLTINGTNRLFNLRRANNISIDNCYLHATGTVNGTYPIYLLQCYDSEITNCTIDNDAATSEGDNTIKIACAGELKITNNKLTGGFQAIDIAYYTTYSYNNTIDGNSIFGSTHDSFTTHPAAIYNFITNNRFGNDVSIRSKGNIVANNYINGSIEVTGRCVNGTVIQDNIITSLYPIYIQHSSDGEAPFDTIYIKNNTATGMTAFVRGSSTSTAENNATSLTLVIDGNTLSRYSTQSFTYLMSFGGALSRLYIANNTILEMSRFYLFSVTLIIGRLHFKNNNIRANNLYFLYIAADTPEEEIPVVTITECVYDGNYLRFQDNASQLKHYNTGSNTFPTNPIKGDTYLTNSGIYAIFDGTQWQQITLTPIT